MNNFKIAQKNIHLIETVKLFTEVNKQIFGRIISKLKSGEHFPLPYRASYFIVLSSSIVLILYK